MTMTELDRMQLAYLQRELHVRMLIQNGVLVLLMPLFTAVSIAMSLMPADARILALGFVVVCGMGSLFWIHSADRTLQIKLYLREAESKWNGGHGWETHLMHHGRLPGLLGSRWFISTKGVFLGAQLAALALSCLVSPISGRVDWLLAAGLAAVVVTAILLRKHPLAKR